MIHSSHISVQCMDTRVTYAVMLNIMMFYLVCITDLLMLFGVAYSRAPATDVARLVDVGDCLIFITQSWLYTLQI